MLAAVELADLHAALERLERTRPAAAGDALRGGPDPGGDRPPARDPGRDREGAPAPGAQQAARAYVLYAGATLYTGEPVGTSDRCTTTAAAARDEHLVMKTAPRQIVAFGGGGFSMESGNPLLDDYVLGADRRPSGRGSASCPRPAATPTTTSSASTAPSPPTAARPSHISLFRREQGPSDLRRHLLSQDLIYVGGGSVVSLLGVWRAHGIDSILREAWEAGVILCGLSAGSLCWFAEAVTGFHGEPQRLEGLGLLPFSNCVHYERGSERREAYHRFLREGMRGGYAAEDGAALHFIGEELSRVVASRPQARGYRLDVAGRRVVEMRIATTYLGDREASPAAPLPEALSTAPAAACRMSGNGRRSDGGDAGAPHPRPRRPRVQLAAARPGGLRAAAAAGRRARRRAAADLHPADRQRRHLRADRPASTPPSASAPASPPTSPSSGSAGGRWRCATTSSPRT